MKKASLLIVVLWVLFFLSMSAIVIKTYLLPKLEVVSRLKQAVVCYYAARSGVEYAIDLVNSQLLEENYVALNQDWANNADLFFQKKVGDATFSLETPVPSTGGGSSIRYGLVDEESKINVNFANTQTLKLLFELVGELNEQISSELAAAIIDFRDEDDDSSDFGAENEYYDAYDFGYGCKNDLFENIEELLLVRGMTQEIFLKVKDYLTVYGNGIININTASEIVFLSLELDKDLVKKLVSYRNGDDQISGTNDDNVFENISLVTNILSEKIGLLIEEHQQLSNLVASKTLVVYSNFFQGISIGRLFNHLIETKITFVFDRNKKIYFFNES